MEDEWEYRAIPDAQGGYAIEIFHNGERYWGAKRWTSFEKPMFVRLFVRWQISKAKSIESRKARQARRKTFTGSL